MSQREWFSIFQNEGWRTFAQILFGSWRFFGVALSDEMLAVGTFLGAGLFLVPWMARRPRILAVWMAAVLALCASEWAMPQGYRTVNGLLQAAPLVALAGLFYARREAGGAEWLQALSLAAAGVFASAYLARGWAAAGGLQWGPRYLLPFYPLLVALTLAGLAGWWPEWTKPARTLIGALAVAGALIGFGVQIRGLQAERTMLDAYQQTAATLSELPGVVATDCNWTAHVTPELYWEGRIFYVKPDKESRDAWAEAARAAGAERAYYAEVLYCRREMLDAIQADLREHPSGVILEEVDLNR
jgi:hypothetical protein